MIENAHLLEASGQLTGVITLPEQADTTLPALIMLNAGFLHHIGPYRLHTLLARDVASQGFVSLRFDLGGVGDSPDSPNTQADANLQAVQDVQNAMDFLQREHGVSRFVVMGLCSGADDAFDVAVADQRVDGALMIDGHGYRTRRFYVNHAFVHFGRRLLSWQKWRVLLARLSRNRAPNEASRSQELDDRIRLDTSKSTVQEAMRRLSARGCQQRFIYTGGVSDYYNYEGQFDDCFGADAQLPGVSHRWFPDSDHLFMLARHREALRQDVIQWLRESYLS